MWYRFKIINQLHIDIYFTTGKLFVEKILILIKFYTVIAKLFKEYVLNDPVFCPNACGRSYSGKNRKGNLKRHLSFECGVMSLFKYSCDICLKKYTRKETLTVHRVNSHNILWIRFSSIVIKLNVKSEIFISIIINIRHIYINCLVKHATYLPYILYYHE